MPAARAVARHAYVVCDVLEPTATPAPSDTAGAPPPPFDGGLVDAPAASPALARELMTAAQDPTGRDWPFMITGINFTKEALCALRRGDVFVQRGFLNGSELALLRRHLVEPPSANDKRASRSTIWEQLFDRRLPGARAPRLCEGRSPSCRNIGQ